MDIFPEDYLYIIFSFSCPRQLALCEIVNKRFNRLIESYSVLQITSCSFLNIWRPHFSFQNIHNPTKIFHNLKSPKIVLIGGTEENRRCDLFCPISKKLTRFTGLSLKRIQQFDAVCHEGHIVVISGASDSTIGSIEACNFVENTWFSFPSIHMKLIAMSCISFQSKLFIIGGYNQQTSRRSQEIYFYDTHTSVESARWELAAHQLIHERAYHAAIEYNGLVWIAGGIVTGTTLTGSVTATVEIFDPATQQWRCGPSMTCKRCDFKLVTANNILWAVGGDIQGVSSVRGTIEWYNEISASWEKVADFPRRRTKCAICAWENHIYTFGGFDGASKLTCWDAYDIVSGKWMSVLAAAAYVVRRSPHESVAEAEDDSKSAAALPVTLSTTFVMPGRTGLTSAVAVAYDPRLLTK